MTQLIFNFSPACSYLAGDFIVTDSNREAFSWLKEWQKWPQGALLLTGSPYSGKTHLATIFHNLTSATFLHTDDLPSSEKVLASTVKAFIIDPFSLSGSEEKFLHFYNSCVEHQRKILLTSTTSPLHWNIQLPDLKSRLLALSTVTIHQPDDTLVRGILLKRFSDLQLIITDHVLDFLITHIERSYSAIHSTVEILDKASLAEQRKVSLPLVKKALNI